MGQESSQRKFGHPFGSYIPAAVAGSATGVRLGEMKDEAVEGGTTPFFTEGFGFGDVAILSGALSLILFAMRARSFVTAVRKV